MEVQKMSNPLMKPMYDTNLFCEIWDSSDSFLADYNNTGTEFTNQVPPVLSQQNALMTYLLLFSRYGNNPIANYDVNQFKNKIFTIIWQYGPAWEKRLSMQEDIRNLTLQEITQGTKTDWSSEGTQSQNNSGTDTTINNHAFNPSTAPTTQTTNELDYIDQQQVAKGSNTSTISGSDSQTTGQVVTKSKMDAYAQLWDLVATDVTNDYIAKFKNCFKQFVAPERRMIYVTEDEEF